MKIYSYEEEDNLPQEWISVKDALPPIGREVIVYIPTRRRGFLLQDKRKTITSLCRFIRYEGATSFYWDNHYGGDNIHVQFAVKMWMPLPKESSIKV